MVCKLNGAHPLYTSSGDKTRRTVNSRRESLIWKANPGLVEIFSQGLGDDSHGGEEDETDTDNYTAGDAVGKVLALVNQIRKSPQARAFFKECCIQTGNQPQELKLWVRTRWASLHAALDRIIALEKVC
ncbi:hypothetical protein K435DRAFT_875933 [Dendrothele bispora CBS 962.96]|uniref:Uncharacterized protein n=1 Tax=Dendrothele bispora (strain CBS 962.96) TaxID=1314807 RepID=A0A4S8KT92_DENBC|nr:hypothetical protein K435DRAFT_875933 [Dendrothele bispora CBS 962.96]